VRLRPRNNNADLLAALSALADRLVAGCDLVGRIVTADFASRAQLRDELHAVEHEADEIHHRFLHLLSHTFVTAIDRDDLRRIAGLLDDCLDAVDQAGDAIVLYQAGALPQACTEQVEILRRAAELTAGAVPRLRAASSLREYWVQVNSLENAADTLYRATIAELFATERDAIRLVKVKEVVERLEEAADAFEALADGVELLAMREG